MDGQQLPDHRRLIRPCALTALDEERILWACSNSRLSLTKVSLSIENVVVDHRVTPRIQSDEIWGQMSADAHPVAHTRINAQGGTLEICDLKSSIVSMMSGHDVSPGRGMTP